jgi:hypothetical protein
MTAEVAILNKMGVALAADSAVSIGGSGKVYNSANKLFALSKKHPVGIMIYGNAHFMSVPWEVVIKHYRNNFLKDKSFPLLEDYADDFVKFLKTTNIFPEENEIRYVHQHCLMVLKGIQKKLKQDMDLFFAGSGGKKFTRAQILKEMRLIVNNWLIKEASSKRKLIPAALSLKSKIIKKHSKSIGDLLSDFFKSSLNLNPNKKLVLDLTDVVFKRIFSDVFFFSPTGVVFAGFGDDQIYPGLFGLKIEGRVESLLRVQNHGVEDISSSNSAAIMPFAQHEMVDTFMCGIDPEYKKAILNGLEEQCKEVKTDIMPSLGITLTVAQEAKLDALISAKEKAISEALKKVERKHFVDPVLDSVGALPLDELAAMAEALVNLTSFKRRVTIVPESVGGPIDVAVISKGDGFIWINRKHYFKPDLNQNFFNR